MNGRAVIMQASRKIPAAIQEVLQRNSVAATAVAAFVMHQANQNLIDRVSAGVATTRQREYLGPEAQVPADLVTTSFSGVDPDISEASALLQVKRVAGVRGLNEEKVRSVVEQHLQGRALGIFGEPHVNVLDVNMALDSGAAG